MILKYFLVYNFDMAILIVIGLSLFGILGDYFLKLAGNKDVYVNYKFLSLGIFVYGMLAVGWFFALKYIKMSTIGVPYSLTIIIALALMGYFLFNESLNIYEIMGIVIGIISILLLYRFA